MLLDGSILKLTQNGILRNLLSLLQEFSKERKQHVVLSRQISRWKNIDAGVLQSFILDPLLFLICIYDLTEGLTINEKVFTDDMALSSIVHDAQTSANNLNKDFKIITGLFHGK